MSREIRKAAVIGSGVMGGAIAAHLTNAGIPCLLLDIVPSDAGATARERNRVAAAGLAAALKAKPAAFYHPSLADLIRVGNIEDDLGRLAECDWIIEAVVERMDVKRRLLERIDAVRKPGSIVSSNTSGLSLAGMAEGRSADLRRHFVVTHFFNPPRYMKLLEIVAGPDTAPDVVAFLTGFCEGTLGKGVVLAKDTPNFIANRIGTFAMMRAMHLMLQDGYSIEEVDAIAGPAMGRPKSAAFDTCDVVGIDTFVHVAKNCYDSLTGDERRDVFRMPEFIVRMVEQGKLGRKAGGGFYKKDATSGEIVVIDPQTLQYRTKAKVRIESLGVAHNEEDVVKRVRGVLAADDRAGRFAWKLTAETLVYAARRLGEIADDVVNVDRAMRWGFNWDMGPFELLDALGVRETAARLEQDRYEVPEVIRAVAASPAGRFYLSERGEARYFDLGRRELRPVPARPGAVSLADSKAAGKVIRSNLGASLIDLGDGVALLEFHSKANAIDDDVLNLTHAALDEVERNFQGLVIANEGQNFCVGANLMLLWMESQQANWTAIEQMVRAFQDLCQRLGTSARPVVVAPHAMALGGGCEMAMGASRMVLAGETYMGLVEVGVGIIPGGGGNKEMLRRILGAVPPETQVDPLPFVARAFQTVALARVSTSAVEAQELRYAAPSDRIVVARDRLVGEAKAEVLHMAAHGYRPRRLAAFRLPGANGRATLLMQLDAMRAGGHISDHDMRIGRALATVMTGGDCSPSQPVTEQHLLDVEREQFMSLCGEEKTQARMQHMLMHGKPLRN